MATRKLDRLKFLCKSSDGSGFDTLKNACPC